MQNTKDSSLARLQAIIETSIDGIITIDGAGIIQSFNPAAEKIFAYDANEAIGQNVSMLMPSPHQQQHDSYIQNYLTSGQSKIIGKSREVEGKRKDGSVFPMWLSIAEFIEDDKYYFASFVQDISEYKQLQENARLHEEEFKLIFENAPTGIAVLDLNGNYTNVNPSLCDILGYSKTELLKLSYRDVTHPGDMKISDEYFQKLIKGNCSDCSLEKRYIRGDKKTINVLLKLAVVHENMSLGHDQYGKPALLISHVLDITEQLKVEEKTKMQQEQLAHMDRICMLGEMAAGIAHEINQPLTAIDSYVQAAQRRIQTNSVDVEKIHDLLNKIFNASVRAENVISRMRAMVKQKSQQNSLQDINTLIEESTNMAETDTSAVGFGIKLDLAKNLPAVMADPIQIEQVILNLIRNAIDAVSNESSKNKHIIIRSQLSENNRIEVSVQDFGIGIDKEAEEKLFSPFYTTKQTGMGMGLAICLSIVQTHGGNLWFTHNEDEGCTFHFTLPTAIGE